MSTQEIRHSDGFLPNITTFPDQHLHESPPSSSTRDHLYGFTRIPLPLNFHLPSPLPTPNSNNNRSDPQENPATNTSAARIAAVPRRAVSDVNSSSFQEALAAANTTYPLRRTMSDISSSTFQEAQTTTTTQLRRAPAPSLQVARTSSPPPNARRRSRRRRRRTAAEAPNCRERLQSKRSKKVAEMMREIEQRCREVIRESEQEQEHLQHASSEFNNPSQEEGGVRLEEVESELVRDNFLKIKLKCSCGKGYQFLCKGHTCFYRLA